MDPTDDLLEHHRARIDRLTLGYWATAVGLGLVLGLLLWLVTPLGWWVVLLGLVGALGLARFAWARSEGWLIATCGGVEVTEADEPRLVNVVDGLCITSGVPRPSLRVIDSPVLNVVAVGRRSERSVVVVTRGLLDTVSRIELEALLANEISQIRSLDTAVVSAAATTVGLPLLLADLGPSWRKARAADGSPGSQIWRLGGWLALLGSPLAGLSRARLADELEPYRDFRTDVTGVRLTRYPPGMIAALERLDNGGDATHLDATSASSPLWVVDPNGWSGRPELSARVAALREL